MTSERMSFYVVLTAYGRRAMNAPAGEPFERMGMGFLPFSKMKLLWVSIFLGLCAVSNSWCETTTVHVGKTAIQLPAPEGFVRIDGNGTKVDQLLQTTLAPTTRLLGSYGTKEDLANVLKGEYPKSKGLFGVQSIRALEETTVTPSHFAKLKEAMRSQFDDILKKIGPKVAEVAKNASAHLSEESQTRVEVKVDEMIPVGTVDETPESISYCMLSKQRSSITGSGEPVETALIAAACMVHVQGKVICLYWSSDETGPDAVPRARSQIEKWRDDLLRANR